jgi:signal transduction histidine kinase
MTEAATGYGMPTVAARLPDRSGGRAAPDPVTARILIVDDDARNLLAVAEMLRAPQLEIVTADSGEAALRHILQDDYAVMLLDVQMPRIDGYELAAMVRARPRSSRVPIIFLTAYNKDELQVFRGYTAGAVDYVFKPIEPLVLKSKVDVFVDLYRKTEEIRRQGDEERRLLIENLRVRGEKLQAERALRRREEHQSLVLRSLPIALYTAPVEDDHRRLHFTGQGVEAITGFAPGDFLSADDFWMARLCPDDRGRVLDELETLADAGSATLEYRWRCADDSERDILEQAVLIRGEDGSPREIFGLWFDITERKQLEQKLLHASKLEAVGRLTGGIAHDFNNMLSVVIGNLDLLRNVLPPEEKAHRRVRMAIEGAQRCADLTNRLLAFSRRQPVQASLVRPQELMPELLELMRRTLGERIDVQLRMDDGIWPIKVDKAQLEAALLNLAVNARDAMPDGGSLIIAVENRPAQEQHACGGPEADRVLVSVRDTGVGMPPSVRDRVFEPFFTTKESGKGTGLGLSMVYGFVQQSEGHIELESAPNEGTCFRISFPRAEETEEREGEREQDELAQMPVLGQGRTILVVEDDPDVRQVTVAALRTLGFEVREAETGDEAAAMLKRGEEVSLLVSDISMPGSMTGIDLAHYVRRERPEIDVLLTSGYADSPSPPSEFRFIHKPYRVAELADKVRAMLNECVQNSPLLR